MQYLFSEEEMEVIRLERHDRSKMPSMDALANVCRWIATTATGQIRPNSSYVLNEPHGCIHVRKASGFNISNCDYCPVQGICPQPKNWSK